MSGSGNVGPLPNMQMNPKATVSKENPTVPNQDLKADSSTPRCVRFGLKSAEEDTTIPHENFPQRPEYPSALRRKCSVSSDDSSKVTGRVQIPRGRSLIPEKKKEKRSQTPFARGRVNIYESDSDEDASEHTGSKTSRVRFAAPNGEGEEKGGPQTEGQGSSDATGSGTSVASENTPPSPCSPTATPRGRSRIISNKPAKRSQTPFSHRRINLDDIDDDEEPSEASNYTETKLDKPKHSKDHSERLGSSIASAPSVEDGAGSITRRPNSSTLVSIDEDKGSLRKGERKSSRRVSFSQHLTASVNDVKGPKKSRGSRLRISFAEDTEPRTASRGESQNERNGTTAPASSILFEIPEGSRSSSTGASASKGPGQGGSVESSGGQRNGGRRSVVTFEDAAVKKEGVGTGKKCVKFAENECVEVAQRRGRTMKRERGKRSATPFARPRLHTTESEELDEHEEESFGNDDAGEKAVAGRKSVSFDWASLAKAKQVLYGEDDTGDEDSMDEERACKTLPSMGRRGRSKTVGGRGAIKRSPTPFARRRIDIYADDCDEKEDDEQHMGKTASVAGGERDARRGRMSFGSRVSSLQTVNNFMTSEEEDSGFGGVEGKRKGKASDVWRTMSRVTETTMPSSDSDNGTFEKGTQTHFEQEGGLQVGQVRLQAAMEKGVQTCCEERRFWNWFGGTGGMLVQGFLVGFASGMLEN